MLFVNTYWSLTNFPYREKISWPEFLSGTLAMCTESYNVLEIVKFYIHIIIMHEVTKLSDVFSLYIKLRRCRSDDIVIELDLAGYYMGSSVVEHLHIKSRSQ